GSPTPSGFCTITSGNTYGELDTNLGMRGNHVGSVSSSSVFMLVAIIHANGNVKITTPSSSTRCVHPRCTSARHSGFAVRLSLIVHPLLAEPQLKERQRQHDEKQNPRQRAGIS